MTLHVPYLVLSNWSVVYWSFPKEITGVAFQGAVLCPPALDNNEFNTMRINGEKKRRLTEQYVIHLAQNTYQCNILLN